MEAGASDASAQDGGGRADAAVTQQRMDSGLMDSGLMDSGLIDSGLIDSGLTDSGLTDSGLADAGATSKPCAATASTNTYQGSPHYHGTLVLLNTGSATWTTPTIGFDLPWSTYVCNDAKTLPGTGWTLVATGNHCEYTKLSPGLSVAPGGTLTFNYSSNSPTTISLSAALNVSVSGCP
jgi:hypothetical protein